MALCGKAPASRLAAATATALVAAAILFIRKPDAFGNPQFWAEDGIRLFADARQLGAASILRT